MQVRALGIYSSRPLWAIIVKFCFRMEETKRRRLIQLQLLELELQVVEIEMKKREEEERREERRARRKPRTVWTRDWIIRRPMYGNYDHLLAELNREDGSTYKNFVRIDQDLFAELLHRITPRIQKKDTRYRKALPAGLKLAVTLRYLATGNTYTDLQYQFRVPHNTISITVPQVCEALIKELQEEVMPKPGETEEYWRDVAYEYLDRWNFPHCLGAMDGKHVRIRKPAKSGSMYFNYKKYFSIVLFAVAAADYRFLYVEVGAQGACGDATIFNFSPLKQHIVWDQLNIPKDEILPGEPNTSTPVPYFFIGDDAFAQSAYLQKPFPRNRQRPLDQREKVYNYRLSRARRVVEASFGILSTRFQCLLRGLTQAKTESMTSVVMACVFLHNLLIQRKPAEFLRRRDVQRMMRDVPQVLDDAVSTDANTTRRGRKKKKQPGRYPDPTAGVDVQQRLADYFLTPHGSVDWQLQYI